MQQRIQDMRVTRVLLLAAALAASSGFLAPLAKANAILIMQNVSVAQGGTGVFTVTLTNDDPSASLLIAGFNFLIDSPGADVILTGANFPASYIFDSNSFDQDFSLPLNTSSGASLSASDSADNPPAYSVLAPGATISLADVAFSIAANAAPGTYAITFDTDMANTNVSDNNGAAIFIDAYNSATITVTAAAPEPAGGELSLAGLVFLAAYIRYRK